MGSKSVPFDVRWKGSKQSVPLSGKCCRNTAENDILCRAGNNFPNLGCLAEFRQISQRRYAMLVLREKGVKPEHGDTPIVRIRLAAADDPRGKRLR